MQEETVIHEPLEKKIDHLEEEARMILPGIQALFGFQLIAVFNQRFHDLAGHAQAAHFIALLCSALAVLLVLTPAAYHRQVEPETISEQLCRIGTRCLTMSLAPLSLAIATDIYVIGELLEYERVLSIALGAFVFGCLTGAWFVFPRIMRAKVRSARSRSTPQVRHS